MARKSKPELLDIFEDAIRESEWSFLHLTEPGAHPARYRVFRRRQSHDVRVYIWNVTHGGYPRSEHEYRIQITGLGEPQRFQPESGGKTLILGWRDEAGVFAGFDFQKHRGPLGASPSFQIKDAALNKAEKHGFATHDKGTGELAVAFRPAFLGAYIENLEQLHGCGDSGQEVGLLEEIGEDPASVGDDRISDQVSEPRRYAVFSTKRALRDMSFRDRVLTAYGNRCAMCGLQLRLLDAAHIVPAAHPGSTDATNNGIALCALHHRAYDRALVTFGPDYRTHLGEGEIEKLKARGLGLGINRFRDELKSTILLPPRKRDKPDPALVSIANRVRGWDFNTGASS